MNRIQQLRRWRYTVLASARHHDMSARDLAIVAGLARGRTAREMAREMHIGASRVGEVAQAALEWMEFDHPGITDRGVA